MYRNSQNALMTKDNRLTSFGLKDNFAKTVDLGKSPISKNIGDHFMETANGNTKQEILRLRRRLQRLRATYLSDQAIHFIELQTVVISLEYLKVLIGEEINRNPLTHSPFMHSRGAMTTVVSSMFSMGPPSALLNCRLQEN